MGVAVSGYLPGPHRRGVLGRRRFPGLDFESSRCGVDARSVPQPERRGLGADGRRQHLGITERVDALARDQLRHRRAIEWFVPLDRELRDCFLLARSFYGIAAVGAARRIHSAPLVDKHKAADVPVEYVRWNWDTCNRFFACVLYRKSNVISDKQVSPKS